MIVYGWTSVGHLLITLGVKGVTLANPKSAKVGRYKSTPNATGGQDETLHIQVGTRRIH